jgi:hypothetical protein
LNAARAGFGRPGDFRGFARLTMRRKLKVLIVLGVLIGVVGAFATNMIDRKRTWAWVRHYFYKGRSIAAEATTIRPPALKDVEAARICRQNLENIERAKRKVAQQKGMAAGTLTWVDIMGELPGGRIPKCPAGGEYRLNDIGMMPQCTIAGNQTPGREDDHIRLNY